MFKSYAECIFTGADIYLSEHGAIAHGDLFELGDVYILNTNGCEQWQYKEGKAKVQTTFQRMSKIGPSTLVCRKDCASDFNADGWIV